MFSSKEVKENIIGSFEIMLFMPAGVERFESSKSAGLRSFAIPVLLMPFSFFVWLSKVGESSAALVLGLNIVAAVLGIALFLGVVYLISKQYERQDNFWKFVNVNNWMAIPGFILASPLVFLIAVGGDLEAWNSYFIFVLILKYIYTGFVVTYAFKLPWEMAGFVAVLAFSIAYNLIQAVDYLQAYFTGVV